MNDLLKLIANNIFMTYNHCEESRTWRGYLGMSQERYNKNTGYDFDECHNAFMAPFAVPPKMDTHTLYARSEFVHE